MTVTSKRAENVAIGALILSIVFFLVPFFMAFWSRFYSIYEISWFSLSGGLIWLVLWIQFHHRSIAEQEKLDIGQLSSNQKSSTIFQAQNEHRELFAVAEKRLKVFEKWFLPIFSGIIAAYQAGIGLYLLMLLLKREDEIYNQPLVCAICMAGIAFVSYLISKYSIGMSSEQIWKPLRAGGSFMRGLSLICFCLAIGLAFAHFKYYIILRVIEWVIPVSLLVLSAENVINIIFDIYRPRLKGQYNRSAFDSRLLGLISEPGGILHTAASAIDYQFGFKVSQTWFYKLLEKAIVPLVLFAAAVIYMLSCIVIVEPNENAVVEHFGSPIHKGGQVRILEPGLSFKWPWPFDCVYKYPTKKVMELNIGFVPKIDEKGNPVREPILWGKSHYKEEYSLLVPADQTDLGKGNDAVPIGIIRAAVPVHYRIKDLYSYLYNNKHQERLLEAICYQELTKFASSAKIGVDEIANTSQSLLGAGRMAAKDILTTNIQQAADKANLGIEILFVGLQGLHPPVDVAKDYESVVGAVQKKQANILNAQALKNVILGRIAGSTAEADKLYNLAVEYRKAEAAGDAAKLQELSKSLDAEFAKAKGDIFKTLRIPQSESFEKVTIAKATGERFDSQVKAYRAAPEIYKKEQKLTALEESMAEIRKFVVVSEKENSEIFQVDLQEKLTPSLYDVAGVEETNK